jgi:hypothetical protein
MGVFIDNSVVSDLLPIQMETLLVEEQIQL